MRRRGLLAGAALLPAVARAQGFPQRPVRLIVPYGAGNVTDIAGRALAEALGSRWPQRVVVENMPGAGGTLGVAAAARAAPDGHVLVLSAMAALTVTPHLQPQLGYDPLADLAPIGLVAVTRGALAAFPGLRAGNLAELLAEARRAGPFFYYSAGSGTLPHLNMELLKAELGNPPLEHVPYRTSAAGLADLLAGRVQLTLDAASVTLPAILDGRLRALFWNGPQRNPRLPGVPTAAEVLPNLDLANPWLGLFAPRGTPAPVLAVLEAALAAALAMPGFGDRLGDALEPLGGGPEPLVRQLRQDHARFGALIARLGIKPD
ncbi:tripartite tricarboxylate transporter substrate binding protein [Belnapia sp. T6]|uniref:Tripartite tricarboxylate transporter substrate binding protein n=1 Tax=Belnapia mucosa TaxID=2804532 RepID=A0ABS1V6I9_9PROT|nr:tripartite tricarboxylate transporter substrate binding protein [Belnapia mucosa]MBL6457280.1 tripartite tricarboxylate transporter substrate binding protein [Belnapia mucosa]